MGTLVPLRASNSSASTLGPPASMQWPVSIPDPSVNALKQQISEQEVVIAVQSNMLSTVAGQAPAMDKEIVKTLDVFQGTQEKQQQVIDSLVEEIKRVNALLAQSDSRLEEEKKTHAAYKVATDELINVMRAEMAALTNRVLAVENTAVQAKEEAVSVKGRFDGHQHTFWLGGGAMKPIAYKTSGPSS